MIHKFLYFVYILLLWCSRQPATAGVVCFKACTIACCEVGVFAFANPLGIAIGVTGCTGVCMVACASSLFIPPACFGNDTTIMVSENERLVIKPIGHVQLKDEVLTLVDGEPCLTRVVRNVMTRGQFNFFEFEVSAGDTSRGNTTTLKVTANHGMLEVNDRGNAELMLTLPTAVRVNSSVFMTAQGPRGLTTIKQLVGDEMFTLVTAEGTVLASGVLVSTLCEEMFTPGMLLNDVLPAWKKMHQY